MYWRLSWVSLSCYRKSCININVTLVAPYVVVQFCPWFKFHFLCCGKEMWLLTKAKIVAFELSDS